MACDGKGHVLVTSGAHGYTTLYDCPGCPRCRTGAAARGRHRHNFHAGVTTRDYLSFLLTRWRTNRWMRTKRRFEVTISKVADPAALAVPCTKRARGERAQARDAG
jgi:hypothetical protein